MECAVSAGSEGAAELQEHRTGVGCNVRDLWCGCDGCQGQSVPLHRLCHQTPGSYLDANMQAVSSWLGGTCVHVTHDDLNPFTFQAAQHRLLEHIPWAGAFSDLGCPWLLWLVPSALICPSEDHVPLLDPVPLPSESPPALCSTARCACAHPARTQGVLQGWRLLLSVQQAPSARGRLPPGPWPGGQGVLAREGSEGETGALQETEGSGAEGNSPWVHRACCE